MKRTFAVIVVAALALAACPLCPHLTVHPSCMSLKTGDDLQLTASSPNPNDVFTWISGDEMIARVDETGLVSAWWPGRVEITATGSVSGLKGSCWIRILNRGSVPGPMVLGMPYEFTMDIGDPPGEGVWTWSGIGNYIESDPGVSGWIGGGDAMGWNAGPDGQWELPLDWPFAFDGKDYASVTVTNTGQILFGDPDEYLYISAFRTDLSTEFEGHDIFVAQTDTYVAIRWACAPADAAPKQGEAPINFEVVLERTGEIGIDYGLITSDADPRIGISTQYSGNTSDLNHTILIPQGTSRVWTYDPGMTPPGLTLSELGVISGTPTQAGMFEFVTHYSVNGEQVYYGVIGTPVFEEYPTPDDLGRK